MPCSRNFDFDSLSDSIPQTSEDLDGFSICPLDQNTGHSPRLIPLELGSPRHDEILNFFNKGWKHPDRDRPRIYAIFRIVSTQSFIRPYVEYKSSLTRPSFFNFFKRDREELLFHGTTRACLLGENIHNVLLCNLSECSLCTIIRNSFDIAKCGTKNKFSRFGKGIYTSACSSKADDYVHNLSEKAQLRVLLLNRVVIGRAREVYHNAIDLTGPPYGYDSIIGKPGADLKYEETVVYNNNAIRPNYIVVYGNPPKQETRNKFGIIVQSLFSTPLA